MVARGFCTPVSRVFSFDRTSCQRPQVLGWRFRIVLDGVGGHVLLHAAQTIPTLQAPMAGQCLGNRLDEGVSAFPKRVSVGAVRRKCSRPRLGLLDLFERKTQSCLKSENSALKHFTSR